MDFDEIRIKTRRRGWWRWHRHAAEVESPRILAPPEPDPLDKGLVDPRLIDRIDAWASAQFPGLGRYTQPVGAQEFRFRRDADLVLFVLRLHGARLTTDDVAGLPPPPHRLARPVLQCLALASLVVGLFVSGVFSWVSWTFPWGALALAAALAFNLYGVYREKTRPRPAWRDES